MSCNARHLWHRHRPTVGQTVDREVIERPASRGSCTILRAHPIRPSCERRPKTVWSQELPAFSSGTQVTSLQIESGKKENQMKSNVGTPDRIVRVVLGVAIVAAGVYFQSWWGVVGVIPIVTAAIGWCPAYLPFGISSCKK